MPMPESVTENQTRSAVWNVSKRTVPPAGVNLMALENRLLMTVSIFSTSAPKGTSSGSQSSSSRTLRSSASGVAAATSSCTSELMSSRPMLSFMWPASSFEKSSSRLISSSSRWPLMRTVESIDDTVGGSVVLCRSRIRSTGARIMVSGVRSSWLKFEKNSVFSRSYSRSRASERCSDCLLRESCRVRRLTFCSRLAFRSRIVLSLRPSCSTIALNCRARMSISSLPLACSRSARLPCWTRFMAWSINCTRVATESESIRASTSPAPTAKIMM